MVPAFEIELTALQEYLEYDPLRDRSRDEAQQVEWDAKSLASTDLLGTKSETMSTLAYEPMGGDDYQHHPLLDQNSTPSAFNSNVNLPFDNPSTDELLAQPERSDTYRAHRPRTGGSVRGHHPLLDHARSFEGAGNVPYPPSAYTQPPIGYMPPAMRRTATDASSDSEGTRFGRTRSNSEHDLGDNGYLDPYKGYEQPSRQGYPAWRRPGGQSQDEYGGPKQNGL